MIFEEFISLMNAPMYCMYLCKRRIEIVNIAKYGKKNKQGKFFGG